MTCATAQWKKTRRVVQMHDHFVRALGVEDYHPDASGSFKAISALQAYARGAGFLDSRGGKRYYGRPDELQGMAVRRG